MKKFFKHGSLLLFLSIFIFSCTKEDQYFEGSLEFSISKSVLENQRVADDAAKSILVTIEDGSGHKKINRKKILLYDFSGEYISEPVALEVGDYSLVEFLVLNNNDEVIYAAPKQSSNLEYLVTKPLPLAIEISQDATTKIIPEVIFVDEVNALDFGYSTFSFEPVETFDFLISVFQYDTVTKNFELTNADLKIEAETNDLYDRELGDSTNQVRIQDHYDSYQLTISKNGFHNVEKTISNNDLRAYLDSPLIIILLPETELLAGIIDGNIVIIDPESGKSTVMTSISNLPESLDWKSLTYHNNALYFINGSSNNPKLYKITLDGEASLVGNFTYSGHQIELVEAIAFDEINDRLVATASLDGNVIDDDFYTESIMEVDITTGECELIGTFDNGEIAPDQDAITFAGTNYYVFDGAPPGLNFTKFYESEFNSVDGNVLSSIYSTTYFDVSDIAVLNGQLYYLIGRNLHRLDLNTYSPSFIGETHLGGEFNGEVIEGMTVIR